MKEGQTSSEYLILAAIVIVIGIIVVSFLGDFSGNTNNPVVPSNNAVLRSLELGLEDFAVSDTGTKMVILNNKPFELSVDAIYVNGTECDTPSFFLKLGGKRTIYCNNVKSQNYGDDFVMSYTADYSTMDGVSYTMKTNYLKGTFAKLDPLTGSGSGEYNGMCSEQDSGFFFGDGSASAPYKVCSCEMLQNVANNPSVYYELVTDLDCYDETRNGALSNDGKGFTPIDSFSGSFEGNDYSIRGLYFNRTDKAFISVFGSVTSEGVIQNLITYLFNVSTSVNSSGLVGVNNGLIDNCLSYGDIRGKHYVGGIVSKNNGVIKNSHTLIDLVSAGSEDYVGGLAGINYGTIVNASSDGNIITGAGGEKYVGGIAGINVGSISATKSTSLLGGKGNNNFIGGIAAKNNGTIINSYNLVEIGALGASKFIGGVAGLNEGNVSYSFSAGEITSEGAKKNNALGGLIGDQSTGTIVSSYYDEDNLTCDGGCLDIAYAVSYTNLTDDTWLQGNGWSYPPWVSTASYPQLNWE